MARLNFGEQRERKTKKRSGRHSKKASNQPRSKTYKKRYGGQGRV